MDLRLPPQYCTVFYNTMEEEAEASYGGRGEDSMLSPREESSSSWDWEGTRLEGGRAPSATTSFISLCSVCTVECEQADKAGLPPLLLERRDEEKGHPATYPASAGG